MAQETETETGTTDEGDEFGIDAQSGDIVTAQSITQFDDEPTEEVYGILSIIDFPGYTDDEDEDLNSDLDLSFAPFTAYFVGSVEVDPTTIKLASEPEPEPNSEVNAADKEELALRANAVIEFLNKCHDKATGRFCEGKGGAIYERATMRKVERATPAIHNAAKKQVLEKIKNAPVPSRREVDKARADMANSKRAGGEARGGNATDRRQQRYNLFLEFGGGKRGYVVDHATGVKMHWTDEPEYNQRGYPVFERGKIFIKKQGGGYQLHNLIPELFDTNRSRGDKTVRRENLR